ncbi:fatty acid hydroxylase [Echinicola strongylocentroti]|uniref:Fatty acid hydroxylase n=1 Tax=Echinicola strongylocentroti TaxID=1795355 RepID=A0A2Z4IK14_9BACT|nr:sterol desaturase family protein [Echinicola strongylocentroti]AWW30886.1 fatty acid hydroxylase [Echinicola strongylocentroti]
MVNAIIFIVLGFVIMEVTGWGIHKYLMHGVFWEIHKTHHEPTKGYFEKNDLFSVLFGSVSVILMMVGFDELDYRFWLGIGISVYGMCYFFFHDVIIHRRIKWLKRPEKGLWRGMVRAHQDHHANNKKEGSEAFGLFMVPFKYFKVREK